MHEIIHTIPDSIALTIHTPVGTMAYCTDLKIDWKKDGTPTGLDAYERMAKEKIHTLFLESTAAEKQGTSLPEEIAHENIEILMKAAEGRVIIGLFASLLNRVAEIIKIAEKLDKKVALSGFSLKTNFNIAQSLGYIKVRKGTIIPLEEISKYKDNQILILSTGAQGEPNASLMKIAHGEHRTVEIKASDTIIFSSSIIPGNEQAIQNLKDDLTRQGARVIQSQHIDVHSSGHGPAGDLKKVIGIIQPQYFVPIHGMYFMRAANVELAKEMGVPKQNSFLIDNGNILDMYADHIDVSDETVASQYVMVDGLGVGDVEEVVLRDRRALAEEGMIVVIATIDRRTGRFLKNPDIISRGFIYLKENKGLIEDMRKRVKLAIQKIPRIQSVETEYIKTLLRERNQHAVIEGLFERMQTLTENEKQSLVKKFIFSRNDISVNMSLSSLLTFIGSDAREISSYTLRGVVIDFSTQLFETIAVPYDIREYETQYVSAIIPKEGLGKYEKIQQYIQEQLTK